MSFVHLDNPLIALQKTHPTVVLAYSGGSDSAALLHAWMRTASPEHTIVVAYVHHGLQPEADAWAEHATNVPTLYKNAASRCEARVLRVNLTLGPQISVEEAARKARYAALEELCKEFNAPLMLGHHRRDQAETFLLQAARGAGVHGLASMPSAQKVNGVLRCRPWLRINKDDILSYITAFKIPHVHDPSNDQTAYARNHIRHNVLPQLRQTNPAIDTLLSRSAQHCAEAAQALDLLADLDLEKTTGSSHALTLPEDWPAWRQKNMIRAWAKNEHLSLSTHILDKLISSENATFALNDKTVLLKEGSTLRYEQLPEKVVQCEKTLKITQRNVELGSQIFQWTGPIPCVLEYRKRNEGELFSLGANRPPRPIKKQYQSKEISFNIRETHAWYFENQLVFSEQLGLNYAQPYLHAPSDKESSYDNPSLM